MLLLDDRGIATLCICICVANRTSCKIKAREGEEYAFVVCVEWLKVEWNIDETTERKSEWMNR